jgi:hypothetical protein
MFRPMIITQSNSLKGDFFFISPACNILIQFPGNYLLNWFPQNKVQYNFFAWITILQRHFLSKKISVGEKYPSTSQSQVSDMNMGAAKMFSAKDGHKICLHTFKAFYVSFYWPSYSINSRWITFLNIILIFGIFPSFSHFDFFPGKGQISSCTPPVIVYYEGEVTLSL